MTAVLRSLLRNPLKFLGFSRSEAQGLNHGVPTVWVDITSASDLHTDRDGSPAIILTIHPQLLVSG